MRKTTEVLRLAAEGLAENLDRLPLPEPAPAPPPPPEHDNLRGGDYYAADEADRCS